MLFQVGGQGAWPTFFEMSAAQQLPASLRAALTYSLGVFALRRPFLHKVLDYEDEFFALLMAVLESHSLRTTDGSFSESLYGLRRRPVKVSVKRSSPGSEASDKAYGSALRKHQKLLSVVFLRRPREAWLIKQGSQIQGGSGRGRVSAEADDGWCTQHFDDM